MADVGEGKTANTHMYAKSVAGLILRDCTDNHIKERVNQSLTTDQRTTMSPIKNELIPSPRVSTFFVADGRFLLKRNFLFPS
jgi:hypothetical protein